jgi:hypothetical protein
VTCAGTSAFERICCYARVETRKKKYNTTSFEYLAGGVADDLIAADGVGVLEEDVFVRREAVVVRRVHFAEIAAFNVQYAAERHRVRAALRVLRMVRYLARESEMYL